MLQDTQQRSAHRASPFEAVVELLGGLPAHQPAHEGQQGLLALCLPCTVRNAVAEQLPPACIRLVSHQWVPNAPDAEQPPASMMLW